MNKEEFSMRVETLQSTLYSVARTYLSIPADCGDAVQESILLAWKGLSRLRSEQYFETWLIRILINECKSILRKTKRTVLMAELPDSPAPAGADPVIYEAIFSLNIRYRTPFVLYHVEGYSVLEIADMLQLPKGTVTSRLQRARSILKHSIGGEWA